MCDRAAVVPVDSRGAVLSLHHPREAKVLLLEKPGRPLLLPAEAAQVVVHAGIVHVRHGDSIRMYHGRPPHRRGAIRREVPAVLHLTGKVYVHCPVPRLVEVSAIAVA